MTMAERLEMQDEINKTNSKRIMRWKVMNLHREQVKRGEMEEAHLVLRLLRRRVVKLYLDDTSWNVQMALEDIGCKINCMRNGYTAEVYI
jgi:hypothetical protein